MVPKVRALTELTHAFLQFDSLTPLPTLSRLGRKLKARSPEGGSFALAMKNPAREVEAKTLEKTSDGVIG